MTSKFSIDNKELLQRISSGEAVVGIDFGNLIVRELAAFRLATIDSEPNCKERKLFCSADTARMRKVISASAGAEATPLYRHAQQPAPEYPEVLPCPVLLDPWLRFGKGIKTSTMLAALARRAVYESDMAALSPEEIVEFQARIEDFKVLIAQPALVVPDEIKHRIGGLDWGWEGEFNRGWNACRAAMFAAAQQSPGGDLATVPGKWIPVSERMPDDDDFVYIWPRPDLGVELHVGQYCECSPKGDGWYAQVYEQNYGIEWHPITVTHWMPLPAAPHEGEL